GKKTDSLSASTSIESESKFTASSLPPGAEVEQLAGSSYNEQSHSFQEGDEEHITKRTRVDDENIQTPTRNPVAPVFSSRSPTRVTGNYVGAGVGFASIKGARNQKFCKVDKTLVCRGFWDYVDSVGRIHLPRRFGKTYNLSTMRLFFSSSLELDETQDIPDDVIEGGVAGLSVAEICRKKREWLFRDSILKKEDPDFFEQHFGKHPVIFLSFSRCRGPDFVDFLSQLGDVMIKAYNNWLFDFEEAKTALPEAANRAKLRLDNRTRKYDESKENPEYILGSTDLAQDIFKDLSMLSRRHFGRRHILFADEYDVPFITVYQSDWSASQKQDALTILKNLFGFMFKGDTSREKGLMAGVFPISLGDLGSGANNFYDITMVPTKQDEYVDPTLIDPSELATDGSDEFIDSFGFNRSEVGSLAEIVLAPHKHLHNQIEDVMWTIKQWYDGYQFDRFRGKYNPWSVCFYFKHLTKNVRPTKVYTDEEALAFFKSCARNYWDETGSPGLIERQMELYPGEFCTLANELFREYALYSNLQPLTSMPHDALVELPLAKFRLSDLTTGHFNRDALLSLALYAGYLTVRSPTTVGIPNGELRCVWESILTRMLLRSTSDSQCRLEKGKLLKELHRGKTDYLCQLIKSSCSVLANHKNHKEFEYANIAVVTINCAARYGVITHPDQPDISSFDYTINRESASGQGNVDWVTLLHSTANVRNAFGMVVEFKHIPDDQVESSRAGRGKAKRGFKQISDKHYNMTMDRCVECIHIGMSIGRGVVHAESQLYKRDSSDAEWVEVDTLL
ncbi:hypothetical protein H4S06_001035, partial [Coemansia sp. BCRC 34490]